MNRTRSVSRGKLFERRSSTTPRKADLLDAARNNNIEKIDNALRNGENINTQDEAGNSALHQAAMFNLYDVISYLVYLGADPEIKNKEGQTVADVCRDDDLKTFLYQTNRLVVREDYGKLTGNALCLTNGAEVTFRSCYVRVTFSHLAENENVSLRCRSVRLEEVAWTLLEAGETACSDVYILSTNKTKSVDGFEIEIPIYNLPTSAEEVLIKTNTNLTVNEVTAYDRKRVSYSKFTTSLPPVLSLVAVCRLKTEVFEVTPDTSRLTSEVDKQVKIAFSDKSVVSNGHLKLQVYSYVDYNHLFERADIKTTTAVIRLDTIDLELSKDVNVRIPLIKTNQESDGDLKVISYNESSDGVNVSSITSVLDDELHCVNVSHPPRGTIVAMEASKNKDTFSPESAKDIFQSIIFKKTPLQFQIGSKKGRDQQKRCKVLVTCSLEAEVDKTVEFWERDGFHVQWCTETYKAVSGEAFSITVSGSMVFCNGFGYEKLQFHPRRRNFIIFEVMSNDVLSNVNLTNVDIRTTYSNMKPTVSHSLPLKKNVYIRKTNTLILEEIGNGKENDVYKVERETTNLLEKQLKSKKKKKKTLLQKLSRENTKGVDGNNTDKTDLQRDEDNHSISSQGLTDVDANENNDPNKQDETVQVNQITVKDLNEEVEVNTDENTESKQKEVTNISSESSKTSLTSLDVEETSRSKRSDKKKSLVSVGSIDVKDPSMKKEDTILTTDGSVVMSSRPVTVRSIFFENPAANLPVEETFFSDAYIAVLQDEIGGNWVTIYILMGIPFDVIDIRLMEQHGKIPVHEILLRLLKDWRDENSFHVHRGVPSLLSALRKGGKWDLSVSVQRRLKIWHDQGVAKDDSLYNWLEKAYADSDVFIPAEYPRPMSDAFLVMFAPEVQFSHHVTTWLSLSYEEYYDVKENRIYNNDTLKIMKALTIYRARKVNVLEMLEELVMFCEDLDYKRAAQIINVSLKGWLKRSATDNEPLKGAIEMLLSKLSQRSRKCNTPDSLFRQRIDVRSALRVLRTPANTRAREIYSEYGQPSSSK